MKEMLLSLQLEKLLKNDFKLVTSQIPIFNKKIDFVYFDNNELVGVEVKSKISEITKAIGQCFFYRQGLHKIYIALPKKEVKKLSAEMKKILKEVGIGLFSVSNRAYDIVLQAKRSKPKKGLCNAIKKRLSLSVGIPEAVNDYKALAHPLRFRIYLSICEKKEVKLKDVVSECGECYPLVLKHVNILKKARLIESKKIGNEAILRFRSYPTEVGNVIKNKILNTLPIRRLGLTITEVSQNLGIHYTTASKYLAVLEAEGRVKRRDIGMAKVFRRNHMGEIKSG